MKKLNNKLLCLILMWSLLLQNLAFAQSMQNLDHESDPDKVVIEVNDCSESPQLLTNHVMLKLAKALTALSTSSS